MCYTHFWKHLFEKMHFEKTTCVISSGDENLISGRSPQVVNTKKTRSAVVISFQVVSRRDGGSKAQSRRMRYSIFLSFCFAETGTRVRHVRHMCPVRHVPDPGHSVPKQHSINRSIALTGRTITLISDSITLICRSHISRSIIFISM